GGRGRRGRAWASAPGKSLTFSVLLRPTLPPSALALLSLAAGLALREAVGLGGLKWPNDLLAPDGRKLAGVLLEAQVSGEEVAYVLLGVGLNVLHDPGLPSEAAALAEFGGGSRAELLARFLGRLEARYTELHRDPGGFLADYKALSYTLGRPVRVGTPQGEVRGVATDISPDGSLLVEVQGQTCRIGAGDVELVGFVGGKK
ncbi:MAG: biotin--[acetyl-CoA-carboxylase] ligase, partial [Deinococcus-Thermus bacterium]